MQPPIILTVFCLVLSFTEIVGGSTVVKDKKSASWVVQVGEMNNGAFSHSCVGTVIHKSWVLTVRDCTGSSELFVLANSIKYNISDGGTKDLYKVTKTVPYPDPNTNILLADVRGATNAIMLLNVDRDMESVTTQSIPASVDKGTMTVYGWNNPTDLMQEEVTFLSKDEVTKQYKAAVEAAGLSNNQTFQEIGPKIAENALSVDYGHSIDYKEKTLCNVEHGSGAVKGGYVYGISINQVETKSRDRINYEMCVQGNNNYSGPIFQAVHVAQNWIKTQIPDLPNKPNVGAIDEGTGMLFLFLGVTFSHFIF